MESNADRIQGYNYAGNNRNFNLKSYGNHDNSFNVNYDSDATRKSSNNRRRPNSFNTTNLQRLVQDLSVEEAATLDFDIYNKPSNDIDDSGILLVLQKPESSLQFKQEHQQPQARASSAPRFRLCINDPFSVHEEATISPPAAKKNCEKPMRYQSPSKATTHQHHSEQQEQTITSLLSSSSADVDNNLSSVPEHARKRITKTSTKSRIRRKSLDTISFSDVSDVSMGSLRSAAPQKRRVSGNKKKMFVPASFVDQMLGDSTPVNYEKLTKAIQKSNHAILHRASIIIADEGRNGNTLISERSSERSTSCPRVRFNEYSLIHRLSDETLERTRQDSKDKFELFPGTNGSDSNRNTRITTSFRNSASPDNRSVSDVDFFINELTTTTNNSRPKPIIKLTKKSYRSNSSDSINPNNVKDVARVRRSLISAMKKSNKNRTNALTSGESGISDEDDSDYDTYQVPLTSWLSLTRSKSTSSNTSNDVGGSDAMLQINPSSFAITSTSDTAPRIVRRKPSM